MSNSQRQRIELAPAWVLHQFDYRDTSRIIEFFVRDHGRVAAVARGIRGTKNKQRGLARPFQPLLVSWSGRELGTVTGLESAGQSIPLAGDALHAGFYLNELCLRLLAAHDPHPEIFDLYAATLAELARAAVIAAPLRRFELGLLDALGYGLNLVAEPHSGEAVRADARYLFHVESGPERVSVASTDTALVQGSSLLAMHAGKFEDSTVLRDAQRILRAAIDRHLGGRILKSREVLRDMYLRKRRGDNE